jgi:hypothetical protein
MSAVRDHFAQHTSHLWACVAAGVLVIGAIIFELPILAALGGLLCAAMMIGMVWMMVGMTSKHHH